MAGHMRIAAVTAAIHALVEEAAASAVPGAAVRLGAPGASEPGQPRAWLWLDRLSANAAARALPPGRRGGRARTAVDLHYGIAFEGEALEAELMLGGVLQTVDSRPVLTSAEMEASALAFPLLAGGLDLQAEPIRIVLEYPSPEELAGIWARAEHRPSLHLSVSPVFIGGAA